MDKSKHLHGQFLVKFATIYKCGFGEILVSNHTGKLYFHTLSLGKDLYMPVIEKYTGLDYQSHFSHSTLFDNVFHIAYHYDNKTKLTFFDIE